MNPLALLLVMLGYSLAIPIGSKLPEVIRTKNKLALTGHQIGVIIAGGGWLLGARTALAWVHLIWLLVASIWYGWVNRAELV